MKLKRPMSFQQLDVNIRLDRHHNLAFELLLFLASGRSLVIQFLGIQSNLIGWTSALNSESYNELLQCQLRKFHFLSKTFACRQILCSIS